ncbi:membrane protein insertion efficiency factor YidD [Rhodococcus sp. NPDC127528]|uniref:membrane protein insertion efficiency factor YidD n=1 Tax=unclassified Rhodococcus (in: high G+C Gram-positive bacteria) TaxID=192944 RepID=UPI00362F3062
MSDSRGEAPSGLPASVRRAPARALIFCIELYRSYVSPLRLPTCRFTPTCSEYAVDALRERGAVIGLGLTVVRLLKCAPWHPGGWDPVPPRKSRRGHDHRAAEAERAGRDTGNQPHALVDVTEQRST